MNRLLRLPVILWKHYKDKQQLMADQKWLDRVFFPVMTVVIPSFFIILVVVIFIYAMGSNAYYPHHKKDIADMWANQIITYIQESFFPKHYYSTLK